MLLSFENLVDGQMIHRVSGLSIIAQCIQSKIHGRDYFQVVARVGYPVKPVVHTFGNNGYLAYSYAKEKQPHLSERELAEFMILMRDWVGLKIGDSPAFDLSSDPTDLQFIPEYWERKRKMEDEERERNSYIY